MPTTPTLRMEHRLEDRVNALLGTCTALSGWTIRERDDDTPVAPPDGTPPKPVLTATARDEGQAHRLAPIRRMSVEIAFTANGKTEAGSAAALDAAIGAVEQLLDGTNLLLALSGPLIGVMLARREGGSSIHFDGLVRRASLRLDVRAVAAERTVGGSGVVG